MSALLVPIKFTINKMLNENVTRTKKCDFILEGLKTKF